MALDYSYTVCNAFEGSTRHCRIGYNNHSGRTKATVTKYMEIPVNTDTFELPTMAFPNFRDSVLENPSIEAVIVQLYSTGCIPYYKTLNRYMCDVLQCRFTTDRLVSLPIPNSDKKYYGTNGAVFDENFNVLMMFSWEIRRRNSEVPGKYIYYPVRPILRISPECFLYQDDSMTRFLAKKLIAESLTVRINTPSEFWNSGIDNTRTWKVKAEIDECPFQIKTSDTPSVSISDSSLLQIVSDHIDELLL